MLIPVFLLIACDKKTAKDKLENDGFYLLKSLSSIAQGNSSKPKTAKNSQPLINLNEQ